MRIANQENWIDIEFERYAKDNIEMLDGLIDKDNCVEIGFDFDIKNHGWGCVGYEYFYTKDIKELAIGFSKILIGNVKRFAYSGAYPYVSLTPDPFYTFIITRKDKKIVFSLKIHDRLADYITVTEIMELSKFEKITNELMEATEKFPVV